MNEEEFVWYLDQFSMHYKLLLRRYERFKEVNNINNLDIDVITYLDTLIVQLRAICIENEKLAKNYTIQNLLRHVKRDDLAKKIDDMLAEPFFSHRDDYDIRKALKTLADKYICHYDSIDIYDKTASQMIENNLRSPYEPHNLDYIMNTVTACVKEGLSLKSFMKAFESDDSE